MVEIVITLNILILIYFLLISTGYITLMIASISDIFLRHQEVYEGNIISIMKSYSLPPLSIVMPVYNEEEFVVNAVESIRNSTYLNTQIILINDGSTDNSLSLLIREYDLIMIEMEIDNEVKTTNSVKAYYVSQLDNRLTVIDKDHTDRSDTMNVGINVSKTPYLMTVDADTLIEKDTISRLMFYILSKENINAAGGGVYILNGCTFKNGKIIDAKISANPLYAIQACEYLRSFLFSKSGWNQFGGSISYSGTCTVFRRDSLVDVGGFDIGNLSQDFEIITRIKSHQYQHHLPVAVGYTSAAAVWTDVPGTFYEYWTQRYNWQFYTLKSLMMHSYMLFNPKYGVTGLFVYPFFLLGETLGAVVEFTAYICILLSLMLGIFNFYTVALMFAFAWGFFTLLTMGTALINFNTYNRYHRFTDIFIILFYTLAEGFGFRQFNVSCRMWATLAYLFSGSSKRKNEKIVLAS